MLHVLDAEAPRVEERDDGVIVVGAGEYHRILQQIRSEIRADEPIEGSAAHAMHLDLAAIRAQVDHVARFLSGS